MSNLHSLGLGVGTKNSKGEWLEVFFADPCLSPSENLSSAITDVVDYQGGNAVIPLSDSQLKALSQSLVDADEKVTGEIARQLIGSKRPAVVVLLESDSKPESVPEVYLKLHLLSHRLVKPHNLNLDGMFGALPH